MSQPGWRDLWPDARTTFWVYSACAVALGVGASSLETAGMDKTWILVLVVVLVLPAHYGLYVIRKRVSRDRQRPAQRPPPPPPPPLKAASAGAGG